MSLEIRKYPDGFVVEDASASKSVYVFEHWTDERLRSEAQHHQVMARLLKEAMRERKREKQKTCEHEWEYTYDGNSQSGWRDCSKCGLDEMFN